MDKIIVVDQGKISEIGKHDELMKNKGPIRRANGGEFRFSYYIYIFV